VRKKQRVKGIINQNQHGWWHASDGQFWYCINVQKQPTNHQKQWLRGLYYLCIICAPIWGYFFRFWGKVETNPKPFKRRNCDLYSKV